MKRLFEIDLNEDYRNSVASQFVVMVLTLALSIIIRTHEKTFIEFNFLLEFLLLCILFNFYFKAQKQRNFSYWGIKLLIAAYIIKNVLKYTFIDYQAFILYPAFLAIFFLVVNIYIMSSPLFFPRVQWWEYDFRYRGDLKSFIIVGDKKTESRVTDIRRNAACVESFEALDLDSRLELKVDIDGVEYTVPAVVKTSKEYVKGRPIMYGIEFDLHTPLLKGEFQQLKRFWRDRKTVKIRRKFTELKTNGIK